MNLWIHNVHIHVLGVLRNVEGGEGDVSVALLSVWVYC